MNVFITGEKGFIGRNLVKKLSEFDFNHVSSSDTFSSPNTVDLKYHSEGELCVYKNEVETWSEFFFRTKTDIVIHNAATVGTDVVALNPNEATLTNVAGTYNICRAAKRHGIPVCYMGTTVIYDVDKYQNVEISESSRKGPSTLYGCQKLCAEDIVKSQTGNKWMIVRPLFAYGGVGDMNSLIAKTTYGYINKKKDIDMFLDKEKIKDYMHVDDYCDAVLTAIKKNMWNDDWNVSAQTPLSTGEIMKVLERILVEEVGGSGIENVLTWHPKTDYLGNHRLSSSKFRRYSNWEPKISLEAGIRRTVKEIRESEGYDPLVHLNEAKEKGVDLTDFY